MPMSGTKSAPFLSPVVNQADLTVQDEDLKRGSYNRGEKDSFPSDVGASL